jgi:uncharacterized protein VirK/YbjX
MRPYFLQQSKQDRFFFLTHHYYLSRYFTPAQRVDCAIDHYSFESQNFGSNYHRAVYRSIDGLRLWHRVIDGTCYTVALRATEDNRHEGDLSILCFVNESRVCRVSFSYVNGALFGLPSGPTMFVTRNQTDRNADLQLFRSTFRQNSPPYFCIAAVCGIAMANGIHNIFMVKDEAQIAYQKQFADGFRNSYSAFWQALGAQEIGDRHAFRMPIPLKLTPLSDVKHRGRAIVRRQNWLDVIHSAREAMLEDRINRAHLPIEVESPLILQANAMVSSDVNQRDQTH